MRALITGATGLLGSHLLKTANPADFIYSQRFDILDRNAVYKAFDEAKPEVVIHCAGDGRVDFAEANRCQAWQLNYEGTKNIKNACFYWKANHVYISTNAVYDGADAPYSPDCIGSHPINTYGETKWLTELMVARDGTGSGLTIVRPIMLYGWPTAGRRDNFVTRLLRDLQTRDLSSFGRIPVAHDIITQPTYAWDCAKAIWKTIAMKPDASIVDAVNIAPKEKMSLFKFAVQVAKSFDLDPDLIVPVPSSELKGLAPRPKDTTYDTSKLDEMGISLDNPAEGLKRMRAERATFWPIETVSPEEAKTAWSKKDERVINQTDGPYPLSPYARPDLPHEV